MALLDERTKIKSIDTSQVLESIESLPDQIRDAWDQAEFLPFDQDYSSVSKVVVSGMGGSALGAWVIKHLYRDELTIPFDFSSDYALPGYVDQNTLVILSSYSGNTEETLSAAKFAETRNAKIFTISTGGKLDELANSHKWPIFRIDPKYNPSDQPRMAIGYAVAALIAVLNKIGIVTVSIQDMDKMIDNLREMIKKLTVESVETNSAKLLAYNAYDKAIILTAAEHLRGAVHIANNQLNENAKVITAEWSLPEFNHHYMEALTNPKKLQEDVIFLLFNSNLYSPELVRRVDLTRQVIERAGYEVQVVQATAPTKIEQVFEIILLGAFFNFYLAMLYGVDPAPIPHVTWFKDTLNS